jgi:HEAT repeat protein
LAAIGELLDPDELLVFGSRALGDPSMMVRRAAVSLFSRVPPARAFPRLIQGVRLDDDPAVLAAVAALAEEHFPEFRDTVLTLSPADTRAVLVARVSRYIQYPDLPALVAPLARSPAPEVREAAAELWRHRPDVADQAALEALTQDPMMSVRLVAAGAAAAAERYDVLDQLTHDPDPVVRREVALSLGRTAPIGPAGFLVLEHLDADGEMTVRAAAHAARLLQGTPIPLPPGLDPRVAAEAVQEAADLPTLRTIARTTPGEDQRLAAALALALLQDEVAREVARTDPVPAIRHRVGGTLELSMSPVGGPS